MYKDADIDMSELLTMVQEFVDIYECISNQDKSNKKEDECIKTPKEKYETIIEIIEQYIDSDEFYDASEIVSAIETETCMSNRELNIIFKFLTNKSILEYVKTRIMNKAYNIIIKNIKFDCSQAIEITGYSDQAAFIKAFKKVFGVTPLMPFMDIRISI